jgi:hypothetical protein
VDRRGSCCKRQCLTDVSLRGVFEERRFRVDATCTCGGQCEARWPVQPRPFGLCSVRKFPEPLVKAFLKPEPLVRAFLNPEIQKVSLEPTYASSEHCGHWSIFRTSAAPMTRNGIQAEPAPFPLPSALRNHAAPRIRASTPRYRCTRLLLA